jgi:starch synthase
MAQGILWADLVTTVSETYAKEILTPEYGVGLDALLRYRQKDLMGIVNGIDYKEYNPGTDPNLAANYDWSTLEKKTLNKIALQRWSKLPEGEGIPLIGMVQRLDEQKGFDIFENAAELIMRQTETQMVILGSGRADYEGTVKRLARKYPDRVAFSTAFNNPLAHLIYSGCDMFLMPSRFEPCGLSQMMAMRYGAIPIVRYTGGLADTVPPLSPDLREGRGFVFYDFTAENLVAAVKKAVESYQEAGDAWRQTMQRVMRLDFSWQASAVKYEQAYQRLLRQKHSLPDNGE